MSLPPLSSQGQKGRGRQVCGQHKTLTVSPLKRHWATRVELLSTALTQNVWMFSVVTLAELHTPSSSSVTLLTWKIRGDSPPLSAAALLPSSSRLTCVITEDGLSITSSSGSQRWAHTVKLGDCPPTPSRCMKLTYTKEVGRERGGKNTPWLKQ